PHREPPTPVRHLGKREARAASDSGLYGHNGCRQTSKAEGYASFPDMTVHTGRVLRISAPAGRPGHAPAARCPLPLPARPVTDHRPAAGGRGRTVRIEGDIPVNRRTLLQAGGTLAATSVAWATGCDTKTGAASASTGAAGADGARTASAAGA